MFPPSDAIREAPSYNDTGRFLTGRSPVARRGNRGVVLSAGSVAINGAVTTEEGEYRIRLPRKGIWRQHDHSEIDFGCKQQTE